MSAEATAEPRPPADALRAIEVWEELASHGAQVIHDRNVPGHDSNIDHIVIARTGVYLIDAKYWSGQLSVGRDGLRHNGRSSKRDVRIVKEQAVVLQHLVDGMSPARPIPIRPVFCLAGDARLGKVHRVDDVVLIDLDGLADALTRGAPVLLDTDVAYLAAAFHNGLPPRTGVSELVSHSLPMQQPPEEIMFLTPWKKHSNDRLYVMDETGVQGGFLDLRTGDVAEEAADVAPILRRLLPHLLTDDSGLDLTTKNRDIIGRFLSRRADRPNPLDDESFVVGVSRTCNGRQFLYVHRIDAFGHKISLGWFDLSDRRIDDATPETEPIVRFCGEQYLACQST